MDDEPAQISTSSTGRRRARCPFPSTRTLPGTGAAGSTRAKGAAPPPRPAGLGGAWSGSSDGWDVKILLLNNRIYGLTKGQSSPTSEYGKATRTTPLGSIDRPFNPGGIRLRGTGPEVIAVGPDGVTAEDCMVHDAGAAGSGAAYVLSQRSGRGRLGKSPGWRSDLDDRLISARL